MATVRPNQIFPGISLNTARDSVVIPISSLAGVEIIEEVDPTSGNAGVLLRGIIEKAASAIAALPASEKPVRFGVNPQTTTSITGANNALRRPYLCTFDVQGFSFEVIEEA
jgi:hypothetical protein